MTRNKSKKIYSNENPQQEGSSSMLTSTNAWKLILAVLITKKVLHALWSSEAKRNKLYLIEDPQGVFLHVTFLHSFKVKTLEIQNK